MIELEDVLLAIAAMAVIVGLWWVYQPLALILPGVGFIAWAAWRRWKGLGRRNVDSH